jgi:hypothetical protein
MASVTRLLQRVIFNVITCNTDAHAKNYSLLISATGAGLPSSTKSAEIPLNVSVSRRALAVQLDGLKFHGSRSSVTIRRGTRSRGLDGFLL